MIMPSFMLMSFPVMECNAPTDEPFQKAPDSFVVWFWNLALQKNSDFNTACTSQFGLPSLVVFLSFHEFFLGKENHKSHTKVMQLGKQPLLFLACCCAELHCVMKRGFISKEGQGAMAPFRNI